MNHRDFIDKRRELYTKLLCDLIRAKTVNPPGDEYLAAKLVKKRLSKMGVKYKLHEKKKKRTNIVAKVGNEKGTKIMITTHLDVVPAGEGWDTDPFEPVIKDNLLYGRGACDCKGQATATLLVLEYLKSIEKQLKNQYIFVYAADEEQGSGLGIKYLLNQEIIQPDYVIVVDVGGAMKNITVAEKGAMQLKITAKGKQAHGAYPNKGISAIAVMSKFIAKLDHYILKNQLHKFLSRPTIHIGKIKGGSAVNMVAASCEAIADIRYTPSQTPESIVEELKKLSERYGEFEFDILLTLPPTELDDKHILVETIKQVAEKHNIPAKPKGLNGATDTKAFLLKDIPAVGFDFADDFVPHNANEYCNLDNLFNFCSILVDVCLELNK
jgi:acetylornithine deacetylase/succinyl-diaminopimelate desuccinylase family protein